ncbi:hypothetical protein ACTFIR_002254 [Dictyostelium discoideum]
MIQTIQQKPQQNKNQIEMKKEEIKYDEIVKVEWIINNGYIGLLRDKVRIAFKPLQFSFGDDFSHFSADDCCLDFRLLLSPKRFLSSLKYENHRTIAQYHEIRGRFYLETFRNVIRYSNHFFNVIKEPTEENYIFYEQLFSNYPEYFQTSIDETFYIATEYDCMIALKVLVEKFNYSPSGRMFQRCIEIGSFNCSTYLNETFEIPLNSITQFWIKMFYNESHQTSISTPNVINERVGYLINNSGNNNNNNIPSLPNEFRLGHLFFCILNEIKLKTLLECIETILLLSEQLKEFIESISLNKYQSPEKGDLSNLNIIEYFYKEFKGIPMLTRRAINKMKFTNDELNIEVGQFSSDNQSIQKLYEMVLLYTLPSNLQENFQFYQFKYHYGKSNLTITTSSEVLKFNCIHFGIYDEKSIDFVTPTDFVAQKCAIFKFCKNDTNKMTEFIMSLYKNNKLEWLVTLLKEFHSLYCTCGKLPLEDILNADYASFGLLSIPEFNLIEYFKSNCIIYNDFVNYIKVRIAFKNMSKIHLNHIFVNRRNDFKFEDQRNSLHLFFYVAFYQFTQFKIYNKMPSSFNDVSLKTKIKMMNWFVENLTNEGRINIFKFLNENYSFIFHTSTSSEINDNPLKKTTTSRLESLITLSIGKGDIHITQYLISDLKLWHSPKEFRYSKDNVWLINYYKKLKKKN